MWGAAAARGVAGRARSSALTSGSDWAPQRSRWLATMSVAAPIAIRARAVSRCSCSQAVRGQVVGDRDRDQVVGEAVAVGGEQPGGDERVARRGELADRHAGDRGDDLRRRVVADHGERLGDRAVARCQRGQATADDVAGDRGDRRRVVARRRRSTRCRARRSGGPARRAATGCRRRRGGSLRQTSIGVSGATRWISSTAPDGDSGCGCRTVAARRLRRAGSAGPIAASGSSARAAATISSGRSAIRRAM